MFGLILLGNVPSTSLRKREPMPPCPSEGRSQLPYLVYERRDNRTRVRGLVKALLIARNYLYVLCGLHPFFIQLSSPKLGIENGGY